MHGKEEGALRTCLRYVIQESKLTGLELAIAVQIGINYKGLPNELYGCINDARNVERFLLRALTSIVCSVFFLNEVL